MDRVDGIPGRISRLASELKQAADDLQKFPSRRRVDWAARASQAQAVAGEVGAASGRSFAFDIGTLLWDGARGNGVCLPETGKPLELFSVLITPAAALGCAALSCQHATKTVRAGSRAKHSSASILSP